MNKPSSRHLTHDFIAYLGLSLNEFLVTGTAGMIFFILLGLLLGLFIGWFAAFTVFPGFYISVRVLPRIIARLKAGKPHGYLKKALLIKLSAMGFIKSPYLKHVGLWQRQRLIDEMRGQDV